MKVHIGYSNLDGDIYVSTYLSKLLEQDRKMLVTEVETDLIGIPHFVGKFVVDNKLEYNNIHILDIK